MHPVHNAEKTLFIGIVSVEKKEFLLAEEL